MSKSEKRPETIRVLLICTGVGLLSRGYETFARECFDGLRGTPGLDIRLIKGKGQTAPDEIVVPLLDRQKFLAKAIAAVTGTDPHTVEQRTSIPPIMKQIREFKPHVVFASEDYLLNRLAEIRKKESLDFRILFSNGGPRPAPFQGPDHIQQVTPHYHDQSLRDGETEARNTLVPYGINIPDDPFISDPEEIARRRRELGLPVDKPIVISVGAISQGGHKRVSWLIKEIAQMPEPRPHLLLLGYIDKTSEPVLKKARNKIGTDGFTAKSVTYSEVVEHYKVCDVFALASLSEGFGRVYLEALMFGLPIVAHDFPVMRYVMKEEAIYCDCSEKGEMARHIQQAIENPDKSPESMQRRRDYVEKHFAWKNLAGDYMELFHKCWEMGI